ncbi:MAG: hypothetical protein JWM64_1944 [Frankiales bacterium]|nr:hypothetical protein [Frankiales bacterium]
MLDTAFSLPVLGLAATSFSLGARHGLDWDHIAAITDLTAPREATADGGSHQHEARRGMGLSFWYCFGHGLVLGVFGLLVLVLALKLPEGIDSVFSYAVGTTLVVLGGIVLYQLGRDRAEYRYAGRVSLVVGAIRRGWARARRREAPAAGFADIDRRGAFLVGLLHGTGAETPTQVVLFASAGASGSSASAALILGAFVAGLVVTDLGIAGLWVSSLLSARRAPRVQIGLGLVTGVASLVLGALILTGYSDLVPPLVT